MRAEHIGGKKIPQGPFVVLAHCANAQEAAAQSQPTSRFISRLTLTRGQALAPQQKRPDQDAMPSLSCLPHLALKTGRSIIRPAICFKKIHSILLPRKHRELLKVSPNKDKIFNYHACGDLKWKRGSNRSRFVAVLFFDGRRAFEDIRATQFERPAFIFLT